MFLVDVCDDAAGVGRVEVALADVAGEVGHQVLAGHVHPHPARLHHLREQMEFKYFRMDSESVVVTERLRVEICTPPCRTWCTG